MSDADRIDWLERNMPLSLFRWHESDYTGDLVQVETSDNVGKTLREAIDKGIKNERLPKESV